jgi:hypothetical protein
MLHLQTGIHFEKKVCFRPIKTQLFQLKIITRLGYQYGGLPILLRNSGVKTGKELLLLFLMAMLHSLSNKWIFP